MVTKLPTRGSWVRILLGAPIFSRELGRNLWPICLQNAFRHIGPNHFRDGG